MKLNEEKVLGFVPARGGSKSIPLKNLTPVGGRPLIAYAISAAKAATNTIGRVVCSTDHDRIAEYSALLGIDVIRRPPELAADDSPTQDAVLHALRQIEVNEGEAPAYVVLFQPTSPFVLTTHVDGVIEVLRDDTEADAAQTITPVPHNFHALNQRIFENGRVAFRYEKERRAAYNKQRKPKLYRFGNLVAFRSRSILAGNDCFGKVSTGMVIDHHYGHDVDGPDDLDYAEYLIEKGIVELPPGLPDPE